MSDVSMVPYKLDFVLLIFFVCFIRQSLQGEVQIPQLRLCNLRCIAKCFYTDNLSLEKCKSKCENFAVEGLCLEEDTACWDTCSGLATRKNITAPGHLKYEWTPNSSVNLSWHGTPDTLYFLQYSNDASFGQVKDLLTENTGVSNWTKDVGQFCDPTFLRLSSVAAGGISEYATAEIPPPEPQIRPALMLDSLRFIDQPFEESGHYSNATLEIVLQYHETEWPYTEEDLDVKPLFHMINCDVPDLSSAIPQPVFKLGDEPRTTYSKVGADLMYRRCSFLYYLNEIRSATCDRTYTLKNPDMKDMSTLKLDCSIVEDAPCPKQPTSHPAPLCGQIESFAYKILNKNINAKDPSTNITVNVTFRSTLSPSKKPLYFTAFYGDAQEFTQEIDVNLLGVNLVDVIGNASNCPSFKEDGTCSVEINSVNGSIIIPDLRMDNLYGVTICAVLDPKNLTFPSFTNVSLGMKSKADRIYIDSKLYRKSHTVEIVVGVSVGVVAFSAILITVLYCCYRKKSRSEKFAKMKVAQLEREQEKRYTELPKKLDIWELERRNLVIYDDKKLGSGAFGAVYMGKLIGMAKGHKDAQSTLGINLMRAENCDVAVKMLPEYADEMSKSEFLKEIALMKTLGYHERLVNMLACITETEPYCLIVEFCSDGDLLHFLRDRCKYMLKLTDVGIDYDNPKEPEDLDFDMIITLKQLLMFAVQISYGLEYLSQKGFVHRDVAARNVLVHDRVNAKIGDFGLCRYIYAESANYKAKGGRLPVKWMSPEAIKFYEFTTKSDVWSFGILMFEIITLGGSPYPGIQPDDIMEYLDAGGRMEQPDNCPDDYYDVMKSCWSQDPATRPEFGTVRQKLALQLEEVTDEYSYLKLDSQRDYYNVAYGEVVKGSEASFIIEEKPVKEHIQVISLSATDLQAIKALEKSPSTDSEQGLEMSPTGHSSGISSSNSRSTIQVDGGDDCPGYII